MHESKAAATRSSARILIGITWAILGLGLALCLLANSVPGGTDVLIGISSVGLLFVAVIPYLILLALARSAKRMYKSVIWLPVAAAAGILLANTPVPQLGHWPIMKWSLEAHESGVDGAGADACPSFAGLARVERCTDFSGTIAYDFGGGFLNQVVILRPEGVEREELITREPGSGGLYVLEDLGDGWYVAMQEW
ncbi:MAG: hypothetical protein ACTHXA_05855 [Gulosibacter sp.]|uniref:hypothetical protein n=1 Tax=Gulosibacter sp. TaxID=2817531 RepID=UPI003F8FDF47